MKHSSKWAWLCHKCFHSHIHGMICFIIKIWKILKKKKYRLKPSPLISLFFGVVLQNEIKQSQCLFIFKYIFLNWNLCKGLWVIVGWEGNTWWILQTGWMKDAKQRLPSKDPSNWDALQCSFMTWQPKYTALQRCVLSFEKHPLLV